MMYNIIAYCYYTSNELYYKYINLFKFNKVFMLDVFPSSRESYNAKLQRKIDFYFRCFEKFNINDIKKIDKNKENIWIFLGAGRSNEIIELLQNENNDVMKI